VRAKWWHGPMRVHQVFPMTNNFNQWRRTEVGICTAASLAWCKAALKKNGRIHSFADIGISEHVLNIQMSQLRLLDTRPREQTERAGLRMVSQHATNSLDVMMGAVKRTAPFTAIFWTATHTMGYRYAHHEKQFFDMEEGLFTSKYSDALKAKIEENYANLIIGYRLVALP
jgi:hypothetical protein